MQLAINEHTPALYSTCILTLNSKPRKGDFDFPSMWRLMFGACDASCVSQVLAELRQETVEVMPVGARMLVPPEQGAFMAWLARALGVRRTLEVGVFSGYSSTAVALVRDQKHIQFVFGSS